MLHTLPRLLAGSTSPFGGTAGPDLSRYFTVCGLLLAAILLLAWGFRKLMRGALQMKAAQRSLQVLDVLPISGKHKLAVVRCYDRTFALGLGEKEVGLIAELDPVAAPARAGAFHETLDTARAVRSQAPSSAIPATTSENAASSRESWTKEPGSVLRSAERGGVFG